MIRLVAAFVFLFCFPGLANTACDKRTARVVAHVYIIAHPLSLNELESYVAQNRSYFVQGGLAIRCMKAMGSKLLGVGLESYDTTDPNALERAHRVGAGERAEGVARELRRTTQEVVVMANELLWLAEVLPAAADGNWSPYINQPTAMRRNMREEAKIMRNVGEMDPFAKKLLKSMRKLPFAEQQVYELAIRFGESPTIHQSKYTGRLRETLVATWTCKIPLKGGQISKETTYQPDGKFQESAFIMTPKGIVRILIIGTWMVHGDFIHEVVVESNAPNLYPPGHKCRMRAIEVSQNRIVLKTDKGEFLTYIRK